MEQSSWNEFVVNIVDNDVLEFIMECPNMQMLHLYMETESTHHDIGFHEPESYVPHHMRVHQPTRYFYIGGLHDPESHIPQVTEGLNNIYLEHGSGALDQHITTGLSVQIRHFGPIQQQVVM